MQKSAFLTAEQDIKAATLEVREARWWYLRPGDPGYGTPLWKYLGFPSERAWLDHLEDWVWAGRR